MIKVILQEQCQRVLFFLLTACGTAHSHTRELAYFDSVWEGGCGLHAKSVCCPTAHPHTRGLQTTSRRNIARKLPTTPVSSFVAVFHSASQADRMLTREHKLLLVPECPASKLRRSVATVPSAKKLRSIRSTQHPDQGICGLQPSFWRCRSLH